MGKKKVYEIECNCGAMIKGFSEHHAKQNMMIHKKTSRKHKELLALKEKWLKQKS